MQLPQGWLVFSFLSKFFDLGGSGQELGVQDFVNGTYQIDNDYSLVCSNATDIVDKLIKNGKYNKLKVPGSSAVNVSVEMWVQEVTTVSEITNDFEIDLYINEVWVDPSLDYRFMNPCKHNLSLDHTIHALLWTPNTCFINSKSASIHESPFVNIFLMIYPNGTVWVNYRVKLTGPCDMDLKRFPMDEQSCLLTFESFNYNTDDVRMKWTATPIVLFKDIILPDFTLVNTSSAAIEALYPAGWWDELTVTFLFRRRYGWYILQGYVPTYLTIFISWIAFYLGIKSIPARTMIGVNSLLAMTMMFGNIIRNLPRVSYVKAIDVWMLAEKNAALGAESLQHAKRQYGRGMTFVFASLLELAVVGYISRNGEATAFEIETKQTSKRGHSSHKRRNHSEMSFSRDGPPPAALLLQPHNNNNGGAVGDSLTRVRYTSIERRARRRGLCGNLLCSYACMCTGCTCTPEVIDRISAIFFPVCFFLFNVFYWGFYLS